MHVCPECGESAEEPGSCPRDQAEMRDALGDEYLGLRLGSHRIARLLGMGGMGRVYLGVHPEIGSRVAIKIFSRDVDGRTDLVERFFAEARATNLIGHEHIINVLDVDRLESGRPYMVMEHLRGLPLSKLIGSDTLTDDGIVQIMLDVLDGLDAAHAHKIIHRDLKPDNIFVSPSGNATLLDFGVAKLVPEIMGDSGPTTTGAILGTPHYMSPEQAVGDPIDARADIYALGVILFECFTGQRPFRATSLYKLLDQHVHEDPPSPRSYRNSIGVDVEKVILKALAKSPENRHQSALAMRAALESCAHSAKDGRTPSVAMRIRIDASEEAAHALVAGPENAAKHDKEDDEPGVVGHTASTVAHGLQGKARPVRSPLASKEKRRLDVLLWGGTLLGVLAVVGYVVLRDDSQVRRPPSEHGGIAYDAAAGARSGSLATQTVPMADASIDLGPLVTPTVVQDASLPVDAGSPDATAVVRPKGIAPLALLNKAYRLAAGHESDATLQSISMQGLSPEGRVSLREPRTKVIFTFHSRRLTELSLDVHGDRVPGLCMLVVTFAKPGKPTLERQRNMKCVAVKTVSRPFCSMAELLEQNHKALKGHIKPNSKIAASYSVVRGSRTNRQHWLVSIDDQESLRFQPCN